MGLLIAHKQGVKHMLHKIKLIWQTRRHLKSRLKVKLLHLGGHSFFLEQNSVVNYNNFVFRLHYAHG